VAIRRGVRSVAISREVARSYREVYGRDPDTIIPNGVDLALAGAGWRYEQGFTADDVLVVSVARLSPQKNPLLLIDALPDDPRCHLILVGDGELRGEVQRRAGPRVHCLGVRSDIGRTLADCDVFALASDYEGLPVAVIEAMAAGRPVVATAVGGVPELIENGVHGFLVQAGDVAGLRRAIAALVCDPQLRQKLGENARERAREFSAGRMIAAYAALFEQLVGARR
jgi:glycosyltransferase involved in cell wall biosynthesis